MNKEALIKEISSLNEKIKLETNNSELLGQRGIVLFQLGKFEDSLMDLNKAIEGGSQNGLFYFYRANCKVKLSKYADAIEDFVEYEIENNGNNGIGYIEDYKSAFSKTTLSQLAYSHGEKIIVKHYGPIQEIEIEIKPITVIIGSTGSGKSTIIKLLHVFRNLIINSELNTEKFKEAIIDKFKMPEPIAETFIRFELGAFFIEYTEGVLNSNISNDFYNEWNKLKELSEKKLKIKDKFPLIKTLFDEAVLNIHTPLYVPVERTFTATFSNYLASFQRSKIPIADFILQFLESFSFARDGVKTLDLPFLNSTYRLKNNVDIIEHNDKDKTAIGLDIASSGFQAIVPLLLIFEHFSKEKDPFSYCFEIEEPELNLFPSIQKIIIEQILSKAKNNNCRLIVATHSPYILTAINNLLFATRVVNTDAGNKEAVNDIIPSEFHINPDDFAAYSLGNTLIADTPYCEDIFNPKTGTIKQNYLDTVSDILGRDFNNLYALHSKSLRK